MADDEAQTETAELKPLSSLLGTPEAEHQDDSDDPDKEVQSESDSDAALAAETAKDDAETKDDATQTKDDSKDDSAETGLKDGQPPSDDDKNERTVPLSVFLGEKDRHKATKVELEALQETGQPKAEEIVKATPFEDLPSIYDGEGKFQQGVVDLATRTTKQVLFDDKLARSKNAAIKEHGEEVVQAALDKMTPEMTKNPEYVKRWKEDEDPYMWVVKMASDLDTITELQDPDFVAKWEAKKEKEIEQRVTARLEKDAADEKALDDTIPDSTSGKRSTGDLRAGKLFKGQKALNELVGTTHS